MVIIKIIIDIICLLVFRIAFQNRTVHCINGVIILYSISEELNLIFQSSIIIIKLCLGERHVCHFQSCMPGSGFFCFINADGARCRRLSRRFYFCLCFLLWLLLYFRLRFLLWLLLYFRLRFLLRLTGLLWLALYDCLGLFALASDAAAHCINFIFVFCIVFKKFYFINRHTVFCVSLFFCKCHFRCFQSCICKCFVFRLFQRNLLYLFFYCIAAGFLFCLFFFLFLCRSLGSRKQFYILLYNCTAGCFDPVIIFCVIGSKFYIINELSLLIIKVCFHICGAYRINSGIRKCEINGISRSYG